MPGLLAQSSAAPMRDSDSAATSPTMPASAPPKKGQMDPILEKVRQGVESKLPPQAKDAFDRIVVAGMKILYSPQTHAIVQTLYEKVQQGGFPPQAIATGMVNFLGMIYKASQGKMSVPVAYPAGIVLLTYVLDDLEKTRGLKVTEPLVKEIGKIMAQQIMTMLKSGGPPTQPGASPSPQPTPQPAMGGA